MTTKLSFSSFVYKWSRKSPARLAGLFCLLLVANSCQTAKTPEEITLVFWDELTQGNIETAKKYATPDTQHLVTQQRQVNENSSLETGQIAIKGLNAYVETIITPTATDDYRPVLSFNTVLLKDNNQWQVDYRQTLNNISNNPFSGVFKSLEDFGETFKEQLEQQMPLIEKELETFGDILKQQLEEFGRSLKNLKPLPPAKQQPNDDAI